MNTNLWRRLKIELDLWRVSALPGILVIALIIAARVSGSLQMLEWMALDRLLRLRPPEPMDERIVIVGINEDDIRGIGSYPVPDRNLAQLLKTLQTYEPAVIGLDIFRDKPVEPGFSEFKQTLQQNENIIATERILPDGTGFTVNPPPYLPPDRIGFADAIFDSDGALRRSLLGSLDAQNQNYQLSLSVRVADRYLATQGIDFGNGKRDPAAMRFGSVELPRLHPNSGGYVRTDVGGEQTLINFRSGRSPFRIISLQDIQSGRVNPEWFRGRIVLVGVMAPSVKDFVQSEAIDSANPALVYGVEAQAHAISQITSAVLEGRPLLSVWADGWEYVWIIGWGILGIALGRFIRSPLLILAGLGFATLCLIGISYGAILLGWWLPLTPALLVLVLNGAGLTAALFYQHDQMLRSRIQERQLIIEHTFSAIHNGPLQSLSRLLSQVKDTTLPHDTLLAELQKINQDLRAVYDTVRKETVLQGEQFYLSLNRELELRSPLHKLMEEVYYDVLERNFPHFKTLKLKVTTFEPLDDHLLTLEQKRGLCRFLEEALCNVGKHAVGARRLEVLCKKMNGLNVVRVTDNGVGNDETKPADAVSGLGTQQAKRLAQQLKGEFKRSPHTPQGTICELVWSGRRSGWFG